MNVLFFPDNKLGASIAPIYNGHTAIISTNTDRLIDGKYALAELNLFKHNIQGTSFLNPFGQSAGENADYKTTLDDVSNTGRISYGMYFRTDYWFNPTTQKQEQIPDYYATAWTSAGAAVFKNAVVGATKTAQYPNHGQQMYDISGADYGFNGTAFGLSNGSELYVHTDMQLDYFKSLGYYLSTGSYANGRSNSSVMLLPKILAVRNSAHSVDSNGNIKYSGLTRPEMTLQASTTRTWDAVNSGQFTSQADSIAYTKTEIARAINAGGWFSDFMHWQSLYNANDTAFFQPFFSAIDESIGSADVWCAGNNEVNEYYALTQGIDKIGSFVHKGKAYIAIRFTDAFKNGVVNGVSIAIKPEQLRTPISVQIDLSGTALAGKSLKSTQATTFRNLGSNKWLANVSPINSYKNGYMLFVIEEAENTDQVYSASRPTLTKNSNTINANQACKFVVWRKAVGADDKMLEAVHRTGYFKKSLSYTFEDGYKYFVGAITRSRNSNLFEV